MRSCTMVLDILEKSWGAGIRKFSVKGTPGQEKKQKRLSRYFWKKQQRDPAEKGLEKVSRKRRVIDANCRVATEGSGDIRSGNKRGSLKQQGGGRGIHFNEEGR